MWHRPTPRQVTELAADGCTAVVTLLAERERASEVQRDVKRAGMQWVWCSLEGANRQLLAQRGVHDKVRASVGEAADIVRGGGTVCIHCAAGIHRTGVFTYALARRLGLTPTEAREFLLLARPVTAWGVKDFRLAVAEEVHQAFAATGTDVVAETDSTGAVTVPTHGSAGSPAAGAELPKAPPV